MENKEKQQKYNPVKTPTTLQMEAVECGAASLTMILGYHKKYLPLSAVREACGVSRDGSKASNVVKAAENYGMIGDGFKKEPEELQYMKPPMILHWNFNHFLVLEGIKGDKVYLNDPAEGKRVVTKKVLSDAFTGIVLTFEKGKDFKPEGSPKTIWGSLKPRLKGLKLGISYIFLAGLALIVPGLAIPTMSQLFIDRVIVSKMTGWTFPILAGMLFMGALKVSLSYLQSSYLSKLQNKIATSASGKFFWHVIRLPMKFFYQRYAADISSRLEINETLATTLSSSFASAGINVFMVIFYLLLMFQYSVVLSFVGIFTSLVNLAFMRYISKVQTNESKQIFQERGKLYSVSISGISLIESIKAGGGELGFFSKWAGHHAKLLDFEQKAGEKAVYTSVLPGVMSSINGILILGLGALEVLQGHLTIGMLVAFQGLMSSFTGPINGLINFYTGLQSLQGDLDRLDDVMHNPLDPMVTASQLSPEDITAQSKSKLEGYVEVKNLTFGYGSLDAPLIENFSFKLKPGSRVALVGMSGSGKSTITKVISGLYKEWSGEILFDGINRDELPKQLINNSIAVIDQEVISFEDTIRNNIKLWDKTISDAEMIKACIDADIHKDIVARKEGYDFELRQHSSGFSGGQLQRIEIARVFATNPSIVIMDEATSSLDTMTEKYIDDRVRKRGCTTIIVAHRLSTIRDSDEIIVLNGGKVEQRGTHEELKKEKGLYATLIREG